MTKFQKIYIIDFLLFTHIQTFLYLSIYIIEVDDCLSKIEIDNKSYFQLQEECKLGLEIYHNKGNPIIENVIYTLGKTIIIQITNNGDGICSTKLAVKINEYNISISNNTKFWNSKDYLSFSYDFS